MAGGEATGAPGGGRRTRRRRQRFEPMSQINVTPFVDVMIVLLIIFIVAAPRLTVGVAVDLPESEARPLAGSDEPLSVSLTADARLYLQETQVSLDDLVVKLDQIARNNRDVRIFLRADQAIDYGRVMAVLGTLNDAGFTRVGLVSEANGQ